MNWQRGLKVKSNYPLKNRTTFKIGGPAEYFCVPKDLSTLKRLIIQAKKNKVPYFIIGAGSNLLISDRGVKGLVILLNSAYFKKIKVKREFIEAQAGASLSSIIKFALDRSLSGLEFLSGVPATLGGAIAMNAGCWGKEISGLVDEVRVMDSFGKVKRLKKKMIKFGYRRSGLKKYIILGARLKLSQDKKEKIRQNIKECLLKRYKAQGRVFYSAGSIFKNPKGDYAARLIERCGLKGKESGGAIVSRKHANFILNKGNAKADDVLRLIKLIRAKVRKKFGVDLKPEIHILS
ncbi:MAG: UDP-N-acetylmuramate dehydrogenase [Candidatus Omnitrophota bacterium]